MRERSVYFYYIYWLNTQPRGGRVLTLQHAPGQHLTNQPHQGQYPRQQRGEEQVFQGGNGQTTQPHQGGGDYVYGVPLGVQSNTAGIGQTAHTVHQNQGQWIFYPHRGHHQGGRGRGRGHNRTPEYGGQENRCRSHRRRNCRSCNAPLHIRVQTLLREIAQRIEELDGRRPTVTQVRTMLNNANF